MKAFTTKLNLQECDKVLKISSRIHHKCTFQPASILLSSKIEEDYQLRMVDISFFLTHPALGLRIETKNKDICIIPFPPVTSTPPPSPALFKSYFPACSPENTILFSHKTLLAMWGLIFGVLQATFKQQLKLCSCVNLPMLFAFFLAHGELSLPSQSYGVVWAQQPAVPSPGQGSSPMHADRSAELCVEVDTDFLSASHLCCVHRVPSQCAVTTVTLGKR